MTTERLRWAALVLALSLVPLAAHAQPDSPVRVGVVVTVSAGAADGEPQALSARLGAALRARLSIDAIAGPEVERRLPAEGLPPDCAARAACIREVAQRLDADQLLFLVIVRVGQRVQIDTIWADAATATTNGRPAVVLDDGGEPPETVFATAATELLPNGVALRAAAAGTPGRAADRRLWIAGGLAAVALAGGAGLALSARDTYHDLAADDCARRACDLGRIERMERRALAADLLFGTAAVAAGAALWFYLDRDEVGPSVGVAPSAGGASVSLAGRF